MQLQAVAAEPAMGYYSMQARLECEMRSSVLPSSRTYSAARLLSRMRALTMHAINTWSTMNIVADPQ
jgi:hypothetical protein